MLCACNSLSNLPSARERRKATPRFYATVAHAGDGFPIGATVINQQFGAWRVLARPSHFVALCRCDCGTERLVSIRNLIDGRSKSCGCLRGSKVVRRNGFPMRRTRQEAIALLSVRVKKCGDCLVWRGTKIKSGYPVVRFEGRQSYAHRLSCEAAHGPPPTKRSQACHKCDNPPCVNPDHLFWGTAADNAWDMVSKGRARSTVFRGSANKFSRFNEADVATMRLLRAQRWTLAAIAKKFGTGHSSVRYAISVGWKHVL